MKKIYILLMLLGSSVISADPFLDTNQYGIASYDNNTKFLCCGSYSVDGIPVWILTSQLASDYSPDPNFGGGTGYVLETGLGVSTAYAVNVDALGGIYVAGSTLVGTIPTWTIIKYTATGVRDITFGNGTGMVQEIALGVGQPYSISINNANPQILYVGGFTAIDGHPIMTVISYNLDGTHNTAFNP